MSWSTHVTFFTLIFALLTNFPGTKSLRADSKYHWSGSGPVDVGQLDAFKEQSCIHIITNWQNEHLAGVRQPVLIRTPSAMILSDRRISKKRYQVQYTFAMKLRGNTPSCLIYEETGGFKDKFYPQRCAQYDFRKLVSSMKPWTCEVTLDIFPPTVNTDTIKLAVKSWNEQGRGIFVNAEYFKLPHRWYYHWRNDPNVSLHSEALSPSTKPTIHMFVVPSMDWDGEAGTANSQQNFLKDWIEQMYVWTHIGKWDRIALNCIFLIVKVAPFSEIGDRLVITSVEYIIVPEFIGLGKLITVQLGAGLSPERIQNVAAISWRRMWPWQISSVGKRAYPWRRNFEYCEDPFSGLPFRKAMLRTPHGTQLGNILIHLWKGVLGNNTFKLGLYNCQNGRPILNTWKSKMPTKFVPRIYITFDGGKGLHFPLWMPDETFPLQIVTCSTKSPEPERLFAIGETTISLTISWAVLVVIAFLAFALVQIRSSAHWTNSVLEITQKNLPTKILQLASLLKILVGQRISHLIIVVPGVVRSLLGLIFLAAVLLDMNRRANTIYRSSLPKNHSALYESFHGLSSDRADILTGIGGIAIRPLKMADNPLKSYWKNQIANAYEEVEITTTKLKFLVVFSEIWGRPGNSYGMYEGTDELTLDELIGNQTRRSTVADYRVGKREKYRSFDRDEFGEFEKLNQRKVLGECKKYKTALLLSAHEAVKLIKSSNKSLGVYSPKQRFMQLFTKIHMNGFVAPLQLVRMSIFKESGIGAMWGGLIKALMKAQMHNAEVSEERRSGLEHCSASMSDMQAIFVMFGIGLVSALLVAVFEVGVLAAVTGLAWITNLRAEPSHTNSFAVWANMFVEQPQRKCISKPISSAAANNTSPMPDIPIPGAISPLPELFGSPKTIKLSHATANSRPSSQMLFNIQQESVKSQQQLDITIAVNSPKLASSAAASTQRHSKNRNSDENLEAILPASLLPSSQ